MTLVERRQVGVTGVEDDRAAEGLEERSRRGRGGRSAALAPLTRIPIDAIAPARSPRRRGVDPDHVRTLVELGGRWPPIVVSSARCRVIDGHHRLAAARALGHTTVLVELFDGASGDEYVEFVRRNVGHGLPLTLAERREAAERIVGSHPDWSDRGIAMICALSPHTVGAVRAGSISERRVGRDGRARPLDPTASRRAIEAALRAQPEASLRTIARTVGASPETVRSVRNGAAAAPAPPGDHRQGQGQGQGQGPAPCDGAGNPDEPGRPVSRRWWTHDAALNSTEPGRCLAESLSALDVAGDDLLAYAEAVPLSRVYEMAAEARRRADAWVAFALVLEDKVAARRGRANR